MRHQRAGKFWCASPTRRRCACVGACAGLPAVVPGCANLRAGFMASSPRPGGVSSSRRQWATSPRTPTNCCATATASRLPRPWRSGAWAPIPARDGGVPVADNACRHDDHVLWEEDIWPPRLLGDFTNTPAHARAHTLTHTHTLTHAYTHKHTHAHAAAHAMTPWLSDFATILVHLR
jgi:hypothetical protein